MIKTIHEQADPFFSGDQVLDATGWKDAITEAHERCEMTDNCVIYRAPSGGNCLLAWCFTTDDCVAESKSMLPTAYGLIKQHCEPQGAGGRHSTPVGYLEAMHDVDADVGKKRFAARHHSGTLHSRRGLTVEYMNLTSFEEFREKSRAAAAAAQQKRQDEDPGEWTSFLISTSVPKPGNRLQASNKLSSGAKETWEFSESHTFGIETTVEMGASFFEVFSVSMSISMKYEETYEVSHSQEYTAGECPEFGVVYWEPVYDRYTGKFSNRDEEQEYWIPRELNGNAEGRFVTECLG